MIYPKRIEQALTMKEAQNLLLEAAEKVSRQEFLRAKKVYDAKREVDPEIDNTLVEITRIKLGGKDTDEH
jgi:hypothetical protein